LGLLRYNANRIRMKNVLLISLLSLLFLIGCRKEPASKKATNYIILSSGDTLYSYSGIKTTYEDGNYVLTTIDTLKGNKITFKKNGGLILFNYYYPNPYSIGSGTIDTAIVFKKDSADELYKASTGYSAVGILSLRVDGDSMFYHTSYVNGCDNYAAETIIDFRGKINR